MRWGTAVTRREAHQQTHRDDRGAATVLLVSVVAVVLALTAGGLVLVSAVVASHHARLAADLGSLAGASAIQDGLSEAQACGVARQVAHANGAVSQGCTVTGQDLELQVTVRPALWPEPAVARGRAGPER
ncbi:Rv3654c family TadE-like protein [Terrabacter sp. BE26]|uniref:Rv3654c family TadE-like protein n=1 Tax=Terrabacter sp. BE26 TaxID=2898152 RepID=UPI0035BE2B83